MARDSNELVDADVEHLRLIAGVINRLAGNSFLLKAWTITLAAALSALARAGTEQTFAWLAGMVILVLAGLDAWYLALERRYRRLFQQVARGEAVARFEMTPPSEGARDLARALWSPSILPIYAVALVTTNLVAFFDR